MIQRILYKGQERILVGAERDGGITTLEKFQRFELGEAHLYPDGKIFSFGLVDGTIADIQFLGEIDAKGDPVVTSNSTADNVLKVLMDHLEQDKIRAILKDLAKVEGNLSYKLTIQLLLSKCP